MNLSRSPDADVLKSIELGRLKEYKETIWNDSSDRTVCEWPVTSTKHGGATVLKTSVWTNTVRNYIRQKAGEIEAYKALEIGAHKWCKEHIPRNGNDLTEEGQILLEYPELWMDRSTFSWECHVSRKENVLRRMTHSCYTTKELLHPLLQETAS